MNDERCKLLYVENNNRGEKEQKKKKFCFNDYKKNTLHSLNEVEYFLHNCNKAIHCIKFYQFFK